MTDKIMEARRVKFETYWENTRRNIPARDGNGYATPVADCCWEFFNIALDSLCVELPSMIGLDQRFTDTPISEIRTQNHFNEAITQCRSAIHAAGVKTK